MKIQIGQYSILFALFEETYLIPFSCSFEDGSHVDQVQITAVYNGISLYDIIIASKQEFDRKVSELYPDNRVIDGSTTPMGIFKIDSKFVPTIKISRRKEQE